MCSSDLCDYPLEAVKSAKTVIAQVNPAMPYTCGATELPVEDIDVFVEHEQPVIELPQGRIGDIEKAIGQNCATLIPDGATLQLGIGAIPDAVLDRKSVV